MACALFARNSDTRKKLGTLVNCAMTKFKDSTTDLTNHESDIYHQHCMDDMTIGVMKNNKEYVAV